MKAALMAAARFDLSKLNQLTSADMRAVGRVYAGWGLSQAFYREELYRELGFDSLADFVAGVWENSFMKMDPYNVLAMLWTGQHADISANPPITEISMKRWVALRRLPALCRGARISSARRTITNMRLNLCLMLFLTLLSRFGGILPVAESTVPTINLLMTI